MANALIALILIEGALLVVWNRPYWSWGLPLFSRRIAVPTSALLHFPFERLEGEVAAEKWPEMVFRPLSGRAWAFRESFGLHFGWRYPPIMRGLIVIDCQRSELRVVGLCSWSVLFAMATSVLAVAVKPAAVLIVAVLLGGSYLVQRHRFIAVESAVRRLMMHSEPQRLSPRSAGGSAQRY
ncbi:small-conductance mechanosensitive channel [Xanthomonas translucens]